MGYIYLIRIKKEAEVCRDTLESRKKETYEVFEELFKKNLDEIPKRKEEYLDIIQDIKDTISNINEELKKYYN